MGPYEILAAIGSGAMGEVFRARDTRLGRYVALKILPSDVAFDMERRQRFEQEARAASALNHPNIVSLYDIGTEGDTSFIVTELVDGESLRAVIQRGPVPMRKLMDFAVQMADGLSAAHSAGIVHRDVKPENVMLTRDGRVKILDFGIAKPFSRAASASETTKGINFTEPGKILGTVTYMSPEQARESIELDGRSDQFSFGVVMYELATGRKAFDRPSAAETMAAIIREDPAPLPSTIAAPLRWTIERCLAKEPSQRYDTTHDLFLELRHMRDHATEITTGSQVPIGTAGIGTKRRWSPIWLSAAFSVLTLAAGMYVGSRFLISPPASFQRLTYRRGDVSGARFSPDGQSVLFSAQWATEPNHIFTMRPGSRESRPLDLPESRIVSISSTGEMAILLGSAASQSPGTLARAPLSGGAPKEILENVNDADWSPDGTNLAVSHSVGGHHRIEYPIGTALNESDGRPPMQVRVSPKGDQIAFFEYDNAVGDFAVTILDLHGKKRVVSRGWTAGSGLAWSPKGDEIWFGGIRTGGEPALHAATMGGIERIVAQTPGWVVLMDVTRDGRALALVEDSRVGIFGLAPEAKQERDLSWFDASRIYDISADGRTIVFVEMSYGRPRNTAIYLRKTDGSPAVRLGDGNRPMLSPDGKLVACIVSDGPHTILSLLPTGAGEARTIADDRMHYERVEWFPDGQRLLFTGNEPNKPVRTFIQDLRGGRPTPITPEGTTANRISPDQKYVTVASAGKLSLFPIVGGEPRTIANLEPGESVIRWSGDGRALFLGKSEEPSLLKISRLIVATGRKEHWKELRTPDPVGAQIGAIVMTPDGNSYAYSFQRDIVTLYLARGLK
jgi:eukaryotic-like serine/threonine-protein kinase